MNFHPTAPLDQQHLTPADVFSAGLANHHIANTAYPIGHTVTMRPYRVSRSQAQTLAAQAWRDIDRLGLYVHIPFCQTRCRYCEYCVVPPEEFAASEDEYFDLLLKEFEMYRQAVGTESKTLIGFDIGGGTPSAPKAGNIQRVVEAARRGFHLPERVTISIETTPKIAALEPEKLRAFYGMGIRRISMGVQTISPRLLEAVGRPHTSVAFDHTAADNIRAAGFEKFNVDVMYGFAGQALSSVEATLRHAIALEPEYITLYRMRYKGTAIAGQAEAVSLAEVNAQYALARDLLLAAGYAGTPGKNTFSRVPGDPGTSDYLTERVIHGAPYLGLGLGAQSLSEATLAYNAGAADKRLDHYRRMVAANWLPIQDLYHLSREAAMGKMIAVSFYFGEIALDSFRRKFGIALDEAFPEEIDFVLREGLMEYHRGEPEYSPESGLGQTHRSAPTKSAPTKSAPTKSAPTLRLTNDGVKAYNGVIALFYAGAVKAHLVEMTDDGGPMTVGPDNRSYAAGQATYSSLASTANNPQQGWAGFSG